MVKGEAYKAYYLANRDRILERNKERNKAHRERLRTEGTDAEKDHHRTLHRAAYQRRKTRDLADILTKEADRLNNFWSPFFRRIATFPGLSAMTDKHLAFLLRLPSGEPEAENPTPS